MVVFDGLNIWLTRYPSEDFNPQRMMLDPSYETISLDDGRILHFALPFTWWSASVVDGLDIFQLQMIRRLFLLRRTETWSLGLWAFADMYDDTIESLSFYIEEQLAFGPTPVDLVPMQFRISGTDQNAEPSQRLIEDRRRSPSPEGLVTRGTQQTVLPPGAIPIGFTPDSAQVIAADSSRAIMRESDDEDADFKTSVAKPKDSMSRKVSEKSEPKYIKDSKGDVMRESESDDDNYKTSIASKRPSKQKKKSLSKKMIEPKYESSRARSSSTTAKKQGTRADPSASAWINSSTGSGIASTTSRYGTTASSTFIPRSGTLPPQDQRNKGRSSSSTHNSFASTTTTTLKPASSDPTSRSTQNVASSSRSNAFRGSTTSAYPNAASTSRLAQSSTSRPSGSLSTRPGQSSTSQYRSSSSRTTNPFATASSRTSNATAAATSRPRPHGRSSLAPVREDEEDKKTKKPYKPDMQYD